MTWLKIISNKLPLLIIILLALFLRTIFLNEIPPGIANDEINIIINAQSLLQTGENIPGVVTGIFGKTSGNLEGGVHSEISSWLIIPFLALFGFSWPIVKLPFVLFSLGIVVLSYLLVRKFINHEAGLIAALLSAISPWSIFFARSGYESILSCFFYLLAIYIIFGLKGWKILWSMPIFLLGLLSYFSAKTLMLPLAIISLGGIKFMGSKGSLKPTLVVTLLLLISLIIYLPFLSKSPAGTRFQELKDQNLETVVNLKRTQSLDSPLGSLYENKYTEEIKHRLGASLGVFSPNFLFLNGQPESIPSLSIPDHGPLYLIDFLLIIIGAVFLIEKNKVLFYTLLGFIAVTTIPNFLNLQGTTYMIRTVILFPLLTLISALGIYRIKNIFGSHHGLTYFVMFIIYSIFFGNFVFQYFTRLPVDKNEGWFLPDRVASRYIKLASNNGDTDITLVSSTPKQTAYRYLLFNQLYNNKQSIKEINSKFAEENYLIGNLKITSDCPSESTGVLIADTNSKCAENLKGSSIASIKDGRAQYVIPNDQLCKPYINRHYPLIKNINFLNIEKLSNEEFCQNFLTDILY